MGIVERFWIGIYLASNSFWLLWQHKKLLIYLSGTAIAYFFIQLFLYNVPLFGFAGDEFMMLITLQGLHYSLEVAHWLYYVVLALATFGYICVLTFFHIGLIKHTLAILRGNVDVSMRSILMSCLLVWRAILGWSALLTVISLFAHLVAVSSSYVHRWLSPFSIVLVLILLIVWSLITYLVTPVIAAEKVSVWQAIKRSALLVAIVLVEIIGAQCWILLITLLGIMPMVMIMHAISSQVGLSLLFVLMTWVVVCACYIVLSAQAVIRALLYERCVQMTTSPIASWRMRH